MSEPHKDDFAGSVAEFAEAATERIEELERRLAALEARPASPQGRWMGAWRADAAYRMGDTVTCGGSSWICLAADAKDKPGTGGLGWDLMVRHGRDASR